MYIKGNKGFWIGFNKVDKENYQWSDGSTNSFTNWGNNQPDNFNNIEQCVELLANQAWNDATCYVNKGWLCKIAKGVVPPSNAIVVPDTFPGEKLL